MTHDFEQPSDTLHTDRDFAFSLPGEFLAANCGFCGEKMLVKRNQTGFVEKLAIQMGQSKGHLQDSFHCKYREKGWHRQAAAIQKQASSSPSQRLADLQAQEAAEINRTRTSTRGVW